ncbi:hypothetical protein [Reichenbachiella sp. MSK19-1]|uniref:hypothetical protein n=1 Tax=Reichenbachiella sp. MSK19-1 TaxID=1897631 RepID=UPI0011C3E594|nr:hypothetical protein [Reichenbachiella sp. MSK19-1]
MELYILAKRLALELGISYSSELDRLIMAGYNADKRYTSFSENAMNNKYLILDAMDGLALAAGYPVLYLHELMGAPNLNMIEAFGNTNEVQNYTNGSDFAKQEVLKGLMRGDYSSYGHPNKIRAKGLIIE